MAAVQSLIERQGRNVDEKDQVRDICRCDAISLNPLTMSSHIRHMNESMRGHIYQYGCTPLMNAASNGRLSVVAYLVERRADVQAKDNVSDLVIDLNLYIRHACRYVCEYIRADSLH